MQIRFESNTKYGLYKDALNLDDNHNFSDDEIETMKQQRISRWIFNLENPPVSVEPIVDTTVVEEPVSESSPEITG